MSSIDLRREIASLAIYYLLYFRKQNSRTKEICNEVDFDSENENIRPCRSRKRSSADQITALPHSPIHPHQDLVKCIEKLQISQQDEAIPKNGHYELISCKAPSEPSLKLNTTAPPKYATKNSTQWHPSCEKINDLKLPTQTSSMSHLNINNNIDSGNQQLVSSNLARSRTHTKSLSTRISSLKRESKTTRTLSIVMFR